MKFKYSKLMSTFVGLEMEDDEYQRQMGFEILTNAFNYIFILLCSLMLISLFWDIMHQTISVGTILFFIILQVSSIILLNKSRKNQAAITEVYSDEEYNEEIHKLRKSSIKIGLYWGTTMYITMEIIFKLAAGEKFEFSFFNLIIWILGGALFGTMMYYASKLNVKKISNDEGDIE